MTCHLPRLSEQFTATSFTRRLRPLTRRLFADAQLVRLSVERAPSVARQVAEISTSCVPHLGWRQAQVTADGHGVDLLSSWAGLRANGGPGFDSSLCQCKDCGHVVNAQECSCQSVECRVSGCFHQVGARASLRTELLASIYERSILIATRSTELLASLLVTKGITICYSNSSYSAVLRLITELINVDPPNGSNVRLPVVPFVPNQHVPRVGTWPPPRLVTMTPPPHSASSDRVPLSRHATKTQQVAMAT